MSSVSYENAKSAFIVYFLFIVMNGELLTTHLAALTAPAAAAAPPAAPPTHTMNELFDKHKKVLEALGYLLNSLAFMFLLNLSIKNRSELLLNFLVTALDGVIAACMAAIYSPGFAKGLGSFVAVFAL
ncbi:hypothetical protein L195_g058857 [Trifolium pratense]|uniref:Uncharacterized protein n=1 Tax=Trifolium pratense TaxID=57577 RepID=A0A2K3JUP0_TRIPR|nr:hypothetical protein L195_g058857 [Trifolium pratense]